MSKKNAYQLRRWLPYGICAVAVSPIRKRPGDDQEMVSQLLFGECVEILERKKNWFKIRCAFDNYEGWIDPKQIINISEEEYKLWTIEYSCSLESACSIHNKFEAFSILLGSNLPQFDGLHFQFTDSKYVYNGLAVHPNQFDKPLELIERITKMYLHAPYLWGGRSIFGIDCSGFTQMVFKLLGIALPRDASQQVNCGELIDFVAQLQLGDLVFFENNEKRIHHVGIALENGNIIHASGKVRIDKLDHQGIYNENIKKYTHQLKIIRRLLPENNTNNAEIMGISKTKDGIED